MVKHWFLGMPSDLFTDTYIPLCPSQPLAAAEDLSFQRTIHSAASISSGELINSSYKYVSSATICAELNLSSLFRFNRPADLAEKTSENAH
jgi:hypothetical protein